jgi:ABC-type multidrug transport system ATPase subunit
MMIRTENLGKVFSQGKKQPPITAVENLTIEVPEGEVFGFLGPNGAGKTTTVRMLCSLIGPTSGRAWIGDYQVGKDDQSVRQSVGILTETPGMYERISAERNLRIFAELYGVKDVSGQVEKYLRMLGLWDRRFDPVGSFSKGMRQKLAIARALIHEPRVLFLDEPTSGLDPGMDRDVMKLLRGLADDGRTVLVVTHSVAELALCDKLLVMAPGGSVAYFGPPDEALTFFGYETWADVFSAFENYRDYDWSGRWRGSQHYQTYAAELDAAAPQQAHYIPQQAARPTKPQSWGSQLWTLVRRYMSVIISDKGFIGLMVILPAVLGVVSVLIPADSGLGPGPVRAHFQNKDAGTILMILAVGACFAGAANSVRELIKERVIYERERATGLSRSAYLMSKVVVLGTVTVLQGLMVGLIGFSSREIPDRGVILGGSTLFELCVPIMALGFTSMMVGLVISSLVKTAEKTMPLLVMFAIIQVVFTGCLFTLHGTLGVNEFSYLMPSRWAVAAAGATLDFNDIAPNSDDPGSTDPLWNHTASAWSLDMIVLIALGVICGFFVSRFLRRHEPEVMRK